MWFLSVVTCCLFFIGNTGLVAVTQKALPIPVQQLDLTNLPIVLKDLISSHPGKRVVDESVLLRSHERLFSSFDPDKIYLLDQEISTFLDPKNGELFLDEYQKQNFQTYFSMLDTCRRAVERSRSIRRSFVFTNRRSLEMARNRPQAQYSSYAIDVDELTDRLYLRYIKLIADRLSQDGDGNADALKNGVMLAEKELEAHESEWLKPQLSGDGTSCNLMARHILKSIVSSLDSHSDVMEERGARDIRERLTKEAFGTGIVPMLLDKGCFVKKVILGSPADRLGTIAVKDQIISIDGRLCSGMTFSEIDLQLNQESDGVVRLVLKREGEKRTFEKNVARARYTVLEGRLEVQKRKFDGGTIVVLSLHSFYKGEGDVSSSDDIKKALQEALKQGPLSGVVIDLRDNGGGYVTEAVRVVGQFIKTGVVMTVRYADGSRLVFRDLNNDVIFSGPMVVLTSKATASASEIVAQALKDYGRAVIVGDPQTYGKGSIQMQTVTDTTEKDAWVNVPMRLTVGRFYTVSGYSPQHIGVKADIVVPGIYERKKTEEDVVSGQKKIDPLYRDSLDDVRFDARGWYQENYLPFVQERTDFYRRWIPMLQKKSAKRLEESPLRTILGQKAGSTEEGESLRKKAQDLQLDEAVSIEEDLIELTRRGRL